MDPETLSLTRKKLEDLFGVWVITEGHIMGTDAGDDRVGHLARRFGLVEEGRSADNVKSQVQLVLHDLVCDIGNTLDPGMYE